MEAIYLILMFVLALVPFPLLLCRLLTPNPQLQTRQTGDLSENV